MNENTNQNQKGLNLMQIIIMVAVVGLIAALTAVALTNSQKKVRDNRRVEDMVMIRSALQLIYNQTGSYNDSTCTEGAMVSACRGDEINKLINNLNQLRDPDSSGIACTQSFEKGCDYAFQTLTQNNYSVLFYLENGTQGFAEGQHILTEQGIQ